MMSQGSKVRALVVGDVMLGRGVDNILPNPVPPKIYESAVQSADGYVKLAERVNGSIGRQVGHKYPWGEALSEFEQMNPGVRLINLETAITRNEGLERKGINYRVSPENARSVKEAGIDYCALANNHVLDWAEQGLHDTLSTLRHMGVAFSGAGANKEEAEQPARIHVPQGATSIVVHSVAHSSSGVPPKWAAQQGQPGVDFLPTLSTSEARALAERIRSSRTHGNELSFVSIHWMPNWGYEVPDEVVRFARTLVDEGGVSLVWGHSSHHAKALEVYNNALILYGCGDFINDYEGIEGFERAFYRDDLAVAYFPDFSTAGRLVDCTLSIMQLHKLQLRAASSDDVDWMHSRLGNESAKFNTHVFKDASGRLRVQC